MNPKLNEERKLWRKGYKRVACLDESGRGPLAGPVTAAAVIIRPAKFKIQKSKFKILHEINDSKKLSARKREELYKILTKNPAIEWGIGRVSERVIDKINILEATKLAMIKAIKKLKKSTTHPPHPSTRRKAGGPLPDFLVLDGKMKLDLPTLRRAQGGERSRTIPQKSIVKADEKVFSCCAASIIAKVRRDRIMLDYHKKYPRYGFNKHKGYPTKFHFKMLKKYGPCKIHRKTFGPLKRFK